MTAGLPLPDAPEAAGYVVAFSAGRDSTVLLHALHTAGLPVRALHVHHGLQPAAETFAAHAATLCAAWGIPLTVRRVQVEVARQGLEAAAREARYEALWNDLDAGEVLVTAHHAADLAETLVLRLLRGTGLEGLAAMQFFEQRPQGGLWRPLLATPPEMLQVYALAQGLRWCDDPHNRDPRFTRVWLRQQALPALRVHLPSLDAQLGRLAMAAGSLRRWLAPQVSAARKAVRHEETRWGEALSLSALQGLSPVLRALVLRAHWQVRVGLPPTTAQLQRLETEVMQGREDAQPALRQGRWVWRRYRDALYLLPWPAPRVDVLPSWPAGAVAWQSPDGGWWQAASPPEVELRVSWPQGGERLCRSDTRPSQRLKQLFQSAGVPPWIRERTPLLWRGEHLVAVAGVAATTGAPTGLHWHPEGHPNEVCG